MITILRDAESKLLEMAQGLREHASGYYSIHFHFSKLQDQFKTEYQQKIVINVINDLFKANEGGLFLARDADLFLVYRGENKTLLEKIIFQLRYLLMDDPLSYNKHGFENPDFCAVYDLRFQWKDFLNVCENKIKQAKKFVEETNLRVTLSHERHDTVYPLRPYHLAHIESDLADIDLTRVLREQAICVSLPGKDPKPVFREIYMSIRNLRQLLMPNVDLLSNHYLFRYLTSLLDLKLLDLLKARSRLLLQQSLSINLHLSTIISPAFLEFDAAIKAHKRGSIVIEIDVADVFGHMADYITARNALQTLGYRICLDGIDPLTFLHLDREKLGANLAKLRWNETHDQMDTSLAAPLKEAIQNWGANRIILTHCESARAIEHGRSLGIVMYQGYYLDKILNPHSKVLN
ncbi:MAG: hypothetical protein K0R63_544 [Rickettsiales bacterium]|jgi:hypothetical protein|nr:hypothetical protein [Rickettsiales bacterium]